MRRQARSALRRQPRRPATPKTQQNGPRRVLLDGYATHVLANRLGRRPETIAPLRAGTIRPRPCMARCGGQYPARITSSLLPVTG